jgi:VWFA-related protein
MKPVSLMAISIALFSLSVAGEPVYAQQSDRQKITVTINTDLVVTWAQIMDRKEGKFVSGLEIGDFALREEGKPQQISLVKEGHVSVVILAEGVHCLWPPEHEFRRSHEALRQLGDDAEIALMAWDSDAVLMQPFTKDHNVIASKLGNKVGFFYALNPPQPGRQTPIRDGRNYNRPGEAVYEAARYLEKNASAGRRKIIIMIGWEWDHLMAETHRRSATDVKDLLETTGVTVYGLNLNGWDWLNLIKPIFDFPYSPKDMRRRSGGTPGQFVRETGGSMLVGPRQEADELLIKLTRLIQSSYTIGYYPENSDFDGRFRRISVELSPSGKTKAGRVNLKSRKGYRALRPSAPTVSEAPPMR